MPATLYQIRIKENLPASWVAEFKDMQTRSLPDGGTSLTGTIPDQAALHGLLSHLYQLGFTLISVQPVGDLNHEEALPCTE